MSSYVLYSDVTHTYTTVYDKPVHIIWCVSVCASMTQTLFVCLLAHCNVSSQSDMLISSNKEVECKACLSNSLLCLLPTVRLIKKLLIITCVRLKQPLGYNALAVRCKQASQLHRKENQSTSVNLSQAGDQIEKWIAWRRRICIVIKERCISAPA